MGVDQQVATAYAGLIIMRLHFANMGMKQQGEEYELQLPSVGAPTQDDVVYVTYNLKFQRYPMCVDLTGRDKAVDYGQLEVLRAQFEVTMQPKDPRDRADLAQPPTSLMGNPKWRIQDRTDVLVRFQDRPLFEEHQTALFCSGILGGLAASFLVALVVESLGSKGQKSHVGA